MSYGKYVSNSENEVQDIVVKSIRKAYDSEKPLSYVITLTDRNRYGLIDDDETLYPLTPDFNGLFE